MNIMITGGAGYIGSHCVEQLIAAKHRPVVVDNLEIGHAEALPEGVAFYGSDFGNYEKMLEVLRDEKIDIVMHFAAYALVGESVENPFKYFDNNLRKSLELLRAMKDCGVDKLIFSSSCTVHGVPKQLPITEDMPFDPISPYGMTKAYFEKILQTLGSRGELNSVAFRYFNAAGASPEGNLGEDHDPETHLIPIVLQAAQGKRDHVAIFGTDYETKDGTCERDYVHVSDIAKAHVLAINKVSKEPGAFAYNLGTGTPYSVREVIECAKKVTGNAIQVLEADRREGDPPALYADGSLAKEDLGWEPQHSTLEEIIQTAWEWHQTHPDGYPSLPVNS